MTIIVFVNQPIRNKWKREALEYFGKSATVTGRNVQDFNVNPVWPLVVSNSLKRWRTILVHIFVPSGRLGLLAYFFSFIYIYFSLVSNDHDYKLLISFLCFEKGNKPHAWITYCTCSVFVLTLSYEPVLHYYSGTAYVQ